MNLNKQMLQMAKQMQQKMTQMQEELAETEVEGSSGGGMVKAWATGLGEFLRIEISPEVIDPEDKEMLEDLVTTAVRDALEKGKALHAEKMGAIMPGGMGGMPGLF